MIWALTNELIETSLLLPGKHPLPGAMTDLRLRNSPRDGHLAFTLCLSFCLVTYNFTSPFVRRCSFLWMFSITTSASDSTRTSRWSSMNPEVRTAFRPRLPGRKLAAGVLHVPFCFLSLTSWQCCFIVTSVRTLGDRQDWNSPQIGLGGLVV